MRPRPFHLLLCRELTCARHRACCVVPSAGLVPDEADGPGLGPILVAATSDCDGTICQDKVPSTFISSFKRKLEARIQALCAFCASSVPYRAYHSHKDYNQTDSFCSTLSIRFNSSVTSVHSMVPRVSVTKTYGYPRVNLRSAPKRYIGHLGGSLIQRPNHSSERAALLVRFVQFPSPTAWAITAFTKQTMH